MLFQINYGDVTKSDALDEHVRHQVDHALRHCADRFTRVEVHLRDDNGRKAGQSDKRVLIEARPAGAEPITVEHFGADLYQATIEAAKKLHRAVEHFIDRHRTH